MDSTLCPLINTCEHMNFHIFSAYSWCLAVSLDHVMLPAWAMSPLRGLMNLNLPELKGKQKLILEV